MYHIIILNHTTLETKVTRGLKAYQNHLFVFVQWDSFQFMPNEFIPVLKPDVDFRLSFNVLAQL